MPILKGYPGQDKADFTSAEYVSVVPTGENSHGLSVSPLAGLYEVTTDAVEAGTTVSNITATGHAVRVGDKIAMTSGTEVGKEASVIDIIDSNNFTIAPKFSTAPAPADTFSILRPVSQRLTSDGNVNVTIGSIQYDRDTGGGPTPTTVLKDTVTPANTRALPVEVVSLSGAEVNFTAGDIGIQLTHTGANPDSTQIGDGTEIAAINASNELQVADDTARSSLSSIDGKTLANAIDANNSTTTPLGIGGVFTGTATDVSAYTSVSIQLAADQDSAADGMQFQFSTDNVNWDESNDFNLDASSSQTRRFQFPVTAQYFRVVYTNGGVAQTFLRVQTILHRANILTSIHRVDSGLTLDRSVTVTKSVISGETTAGGGSFVNVKVNPSGALLNEPTQATHDDLNANANMQVGDVDVSGFNPVPMSAASLPLPTGAATEATLSTVAGDTTSLDGKVPAQGAAVTAASLPVNIASDQTVPVSAASLPLPTGAATETTLSTVAGDTTSLDAKVPAQGAAVTAASLPVNIASDQTVPVSAASLPLPSGAATEATLATIDADTSLLAGTVAGSELQVDVVTSALPTGAATESTLSTVETNTNPLDVDDAEYVDFSASNLPGNATNPLQLVASLAANVKKIQVYDTGGVFMELMTGAAASEVRKLIIGPGSNETIEVDLPATTRVSIRRLDSASALAVGEFGINFLGDA